MLKVLTAALTIAVFCLAPRAQTTLSGRYEGTADIQGRGTLAISAELREQGSKVSGVVHTPLGDAEIIKGTLSAGVLSITVDAGGDDLLLDGKIAVDGSISGQVSGNAAKGTFALRRVGDLPTEADTAPVSHQSKDKWREDLRYLATELPRRHKNAFNQISRAQWDALVSDLDTRIPTISDEEIILSMSRIVSRIGDGHTGLGWGRLFPRLPIRYCWFDDELRVIQVSKEYPKLIGVRVTKINGKDVKKLYEASREYIALNESEQYVLNANPFLITYPIFLKVAGAGKSEAEATLEYIDSNGGSSSTTIKALASESTVDWLQAYKSPPMYLKNPEAPFYYEYLKDEKSVYVNFKWYPRRPEFKKFSDELFDFIDHHDVDKLVFDFRLNGGGDFTRGRDYFVKPIKERKKFLERGHLFAITGRRTFSAGMTNAADFRNDLHAILVGEPTGARPNGYQENRGFSLPNSHLPVSYSIELYKFSDTDTPGIIPDKVISPDWKSYAAGRDPALEWILAYRGTK